MAGEIDIGFRTERQATAAAQAARRSSSGPLVPARARRPELSTTIKRSREDVFDYLTDIDTTAFYVPGVSRCDFVEGRGPDSCDGVGVEFDATIVRLGRSMDIRVEVIEYEAARLIVTRSKSGPVSFTQRTTASDEDGATRVDRVVEIETHGFFGALTEPFLRASAVRNARLELATLKDLLESGADQLKLAPAGQDSALSAAVG